MIKLYLLYNEQNLGGCSGHKNTKIDLDEVKSESKVTFITAKYTYVTYKLEAHTYIQSYNNSLHEDK